MTMDRKTVLIADDDSDLADALAKRCERLGLKTVVVYDGLSTLTTLAERQPDLVCLDLNMPFGSGMDVCRMLATDALLASVPVIVLTCRSDAETVRYCRSMGAHYVLKSGDLWNHVEPLIRRRLHLLAEEAGGQDAVEPMACLPAGPGLAGRSPEDVTHSVSWRLAGGNANDDTENGPHRRR